LILSLKHGSLIASEVVDSVSFSAAAAVAWEQQQQQQQQH
jgi:hypothetical protein